MQGVHYSHCDSKPRNILLDVNFQPKVADFGMAKLLGREFSRVLTSMRGTIGYLAPESISRSAITPKEDIYSYGMMLFEIISGRRNTSKFEGRNVRYFPVWAAAKLNEGEVLSLLDRRLNGNADLEELTRACRVACWCIQDEEADRPSIGKVVHRMQSWNQYINLPADTCDSYAFCGGYNLCNTGNTPICGCLKGFVPKSPKEWDMADWSSGCVRRTPLDCQKGDGFIKYSGFKMPDTRYSWFNASMTLEECKLVCLKNCSCMAYANLNISAGGSGCLLWFGDLIDIKDYSEERQVIYIRMASSEVGGSNRKKRSWIILSSVLLGGMVLLGLGLTLFFRKKNQPSIEENKPRPERCYTTEELDLPLFDLATIANATNDFSNNNKLGEGGFGPVYKGVLEDRQEIAVKRLSKNSRQGLNEFKNEVVHIAKLQHRNLVKLLGCCIQVEEMMLIYEFMSNKSLDFFIFDHSQSKLLDWPKRFHIINGIAQGLLYLHRDSRLRIIHRDLKASNILLDHEMNPKISDFGLSRSFGGNEIEANTNKVVGTYGYMSPEYAIDGLYSIKSDVFSFGVLLLEIVSGKRNRCFYHPDHHLNLIGHAWRLYIEGKPMELVDALIGDLDSHNLFDVLRSIHVGLLCVQQCPEDRPRMSSVVLMLGGEGALPQPKQPGFFIERKLVETYLSSGKHELCSPNGLSITLLEAR